MISAFGSFRSEQDELQELSKNKGPICWEHKMEKMAPRKFSE